MYIYTKYNTVYVWVAPPYTPSGVDGWLPNLLDIRRKACRPRLPSSTWDTMLRLAYPPWAILKSSLGSARVHIFKPWLQMGTFRNYLVVCPLKRRHQHWGPFGNGTNRSIQILSCSKQLWGMLTFQSTSPSLLMRTKGLATKKGGSLSLHFNRPLVLAAGAPQMYRPFGWKWFEHFGFYIYYIYTCMHM